MNTTEFGCKGRRWLTFAIVAAIGLFACQKKDDPAVQTSSTAGASAQSVLTLKGAGQ
jgi:hypothetical protein